MSCEGPFQVKNGTRVEYVEVQKKEDMVCSVGMTEVIKKQVLLTRCTRLLRIDVIY